MTDVEATASTVGAGPPPLDPRAITAAVVLLLMPISRVLVVFDSRDGPDYQSHTALFAADIALAVLVVQQATRSRDLLHTWRDHLGAVAALVLAASLVPAFVAHPSDRGVAALLRLVGVGAFALAVASFGPLERRFVAGAGAAVLALSALASAYQVLTGGPVGLQAIGEDSEAVIRMVGGLAPFGLFVHPYVQAAWAVVAGLGLLALRVDERSSFYAPLPLIVLGLVPIGLTLCRSSVLSCVLAAIPMIVLAVSGVDRRRALVLVASGAIVVAGSVVWNLDGWLGRADQTVSTGDPTALRGSLLDQARGLAVEDKVLGVGPGRYVLELQRRPDLQRLNPQLPRPVHNVPLLVLVEGGLVALPALVLLIVAVARQTWRAGAAGWVLLLAFLPFLLLDHLAWSFPQGLILTALWLGWLDALARGARR